MTPNCDTASNPIVAAYGAERRWITWQLRNLKDGTTQKYPIQRINNPAEHMTFSEAVELAKRSNHGIGIILGNGLVGIDFDWRHDPDAPVHRIPDLLVPYVAIQASYTEWSPSKKGVHILATSDNCEAIAPLKTDGIEIYPRNRFFTFTGEVLSDYETVRPYDPSIFTHLYDNEKTAAQQSSSAAISSGSRNNTLYSLARSMRAKGFEHDEILAALEIRNKSCVPPLESRELQSLVQSASRHLPGAAKEAVNPDNWPELFHSFEELSNCPPPKWIIQGFAEQFDKGLIGGLSGHGKTFILLSITSALLKSRDDLNAKLWGYFPVPSVEHKVMYLIPEVGAASFARRLKLFGLIEFVRDGRLLVRTLSKGPNVSLGDPRIVKAAEGRHVFLDTAIRFGEGDESSASDNQTLANNIFGLESAGASSVWGAHHSPKSFESADRMTLENVLRGSGDLGAMLSIAYGVRQLDADRGRTLIHVSCLKPRDIDPPGDFQIEGKPWIERDGDFRMVSEPGKTGPLSDYLARSRDGRPSKLDESQVREMLSAGKTKQEIAAAVSVSVRTLQRFCKQRSFRKDVEF